MAAELLWYIDEKLLTLSPGHPDRKFLEEQHRIFTEFQESIPLKPQSQRGLQRLWTDFGCQF